MGINQKEIRFGEERLNNQGSLMRIVEYVNNSDVIVEFQDEYRGRVHTQYINFQKGGVKNPYHPDVHGIGMIGNKYPSKIDGIRLKEYIAWISILCRCTNKKLKEKESTYQDVVCCNEWLLYENFYEWLHSQENFDKWLNGDRWAVDKDILIKGNKTYSSETCCLVPQNVNSLFVKNDMRRGELPVGVCRRGKSFEASCNNPILGKYIYLGLYKTPEKAFQAYKQYKEALVKQVAEIEYSKGNITKRCYDAMMDYKVKITD